MVFSGFSFETGLDFALHRSETGYGFRGRVAKVYNRICCQLRMNKKRSNNRNIPFELNFNNFVVGALDQV